MKMQEENTYGLNYKRGVIEIHEAAAQHYSLIQKLAQQTWPHTFKEILSTKQIAYMLEMMYSIPSLTEQVEKRGHIFLLAKNGADYLGYASYEVNYTGMSKTKIHKIYILPRAQGKGVGKLLMLEIAERAQQQKNTVLSLNVNRDNKAMHFYQKIGFQKVGEENISIGNGYMMEDAIMEKNLNVSSSK